MPFVDTSISITRDPSCRTTQCDAEMCGRLIRRFACGARPMTHDVASSAWSAVSVSGVSVSERKPYGSAGGALLFADERDEREEAGDC